MLFPVSPYLFEASKSPVRSFPHKSRHQLEARGEAHLVAGPGDHDMAGFQRLAKDFEDLAVELGQLIEEQNAVMCQTDLAGLRAAAAVSSIREC